MKQTHFGYRRPDRAAVCQLDTTTRSLRPAGVEKCSVTSREMHDVFIVISEGWGGAHTVRTVYAADHDDARQTHQANYADEPIVAVHQ